MQGDGSIDSVRFVQPTQMRDDGANDVRACSHFELGDRLMLRETHNRFEQEPGRLGAGKNLEHYVLLAPVLDIAFDFLVVEVRATRLKPSIELKSGVKDLAIVAPQFEAAHVCEEGMTKLPVRRHAPDFLHKGDARFCTFSFAKGNEHHKLGCENVEENPVEFTKGRVRDKSPGAASSCGPPGDTDVNGDVYTGEDSRYADPYDIECPSSL